MLIVLMNMVLCRNSFTFFFCRLYVIILLFIFIFNYRSGALGYW